MIFNDDQFAVLSKYEQNFHEVIDWKVARNIGDRASAEIAEIWHSVNHTPLRKYTCAQCRYNLLRNVGLAYRKDKAERAEIACREALKSNEEIPPTKETTKKRKSAKKA